MKITKWLYDERVSFVQILSILAALIVGNILFVLRLSPSTLIWVVLTLSLLNALFFEWRALLQHFSWAPKHRWQLNYGWYYSFKYHLLFLVCLTIGILIFFYAPH